VMAMYPVLTAATYDLTLFLITSVIGGLAWSLVGGALGNFILDEIPVDDRPAHLAWYNLALNGAILAGSLLGPLAAESAGLRMTLAAIGVLRLLAALSLLVTGRRPAPDAHAGPAQVITEPAGRERPIGR
jgi:predicted MFS family arabinose efflux permease